jgi:hypothetical protein
MLAIEYTHKRVRLFRVELNFQVVMGLILVIITWKLFAILRIIF